MKVATRRLLEEQLVAVAVLGSGKKSDAMWHVPHTLSRHAEEDLCTLSDMLVKICRLGR